jgi:acetyltransferase-like isoleucine patch superfamily enzyme
LSIIFGFLFSIILMRKIYKTIFSPLLMNRDSHIYLVSYHTRKNALRGWARVNCGLKTTVNFCVLWLARFLPSVSFKNIIYRLLGVVVGKDSAIALGVMLDIFHPELIKIGDNSIIGYNTVILTHEFLTDRYRIGSVEIGNNVMIGANCTVLPGVKIGDGAIISAMSLVNRDVPPHAYAQGIPIRISMKRMKKKRLTRKTRR